ncbi:Hypothetical predicted protein [Olea europaea subsp. europaea]|uniref:Uncharacterized protein n=1 Tax=Olea europaea subsp. europaea TaxID=158383 RepID=A0A8S0ULX4_OLEEU|nr:Hypothetical predicted protein [Olea europaea subsp. europaea]
MQLNVIKICQFEHFLGITQLFVNLICQFRKFRPHLYSYPHHSRNRVFFQPSRLWEMGFGNDRTQTSTASQVKRKRDAPSDQDVYYEERLRRMILESAWRECYERYEGRMKAMDDQLAILRSEVEFVRSKKIGFDSTPCADNGRVRKMRLGPMPPQVRSKRDAPSELYEERFQRRMKAFDDQLAFLRSEVEHLRSQVA